MLLVGVVSGVIAMLLVFGASYLVGVIYELVKFQHPSEHELLGAMKQASQFEKSILVIGACVVAPLFEELLFRGHLQTLLVRLFTGATTTPPTPVMPAPAPAPPIGPEGVPLYDIPAAAATTAVAVAPTAPMDSSNSAMPTYDSKRARWLAVTITALIFALVHPLWTAPLIFLLALCLGYAYERTGSIWVPIVMHAMFNISSTFLFLNFM
jgi:membrane protease YdiL (CAAX protease family)